MIKKNVYDNQIDHVWYDSGNVVYSKCYDNNNLPTKTLKVVFSKGQTYVYRGIDPNDYLSFKGAESNGSAFHKYIKKYDGVRISDTDLSELEELSKTFESEEEELNDTTIKDLVYTLNVNEESGEFEILYNGKQVFTGLEGQVSVVKLFKSLNLKHVINQVEKIETVSDEFDDSISTTITTSNNV